MPIWLRMNRSFKVKLIFSLSCIILLAFGITGYLTNRYNLKLFEEEISKQFYQTSAAATEKLDLRIQEMVRVTQTVVFNPELERLIQSMSADKSTDAYRQYDDKKQLEAQMSLIKYDQPYITGMYMFDLNGKLALYSFTSATINMLDEATVNTIRNRISDSYGDLVWMSMKLPSSIEPSGYRNTIIAARWMKNGNLQTYGMLVMAIDATFFSNSLKELTREGAGEVYLFNPNDELLYTNMNTLTPDALAGIRTVAASRIIDNRLFIRSATQSTAFHLVSGTSLNEIKQKNRNLSQRIYYSGLASIVLTSILIALFTGKLLRPLKDLQSGLRKVRSGNFDARVDIQTKDELAYIGESFNAMTAQVGHLIKEVYLTQLSEKEAELKALQAQLNPHFLHNLFNEIYWKLFLKEEKEVAGLIGTVSEMLKYSLMPVRTLTTVGEEFQQIRNYVKVQGELFEPDLETMIQVDEEVMEVKMMRALLQPLVENVFIHAFRNKITQKVLLITARKDGDRLEIEVKDNGCGMEEKTIYDLLGQPGTSRLRLDGRESLGVQSVWRRIELVHGPPYRLEISSTPGSGTTMRLILPYMTEERKEEHHG
ncbi:sensor histidine kinase [Paenibacillus whitsoniae]|nr:histidine kinase [Paenibacillus whitsoniae]